MAKLINLIPIPNLKEAKDDLADLRAGKTNENQKQTLKKEKSLNEVNSNTYRTLEKYLKSIIGKPFDKKMIDDITDMALDLAKEYYRDGARNGFER
jgi:hypothetical protein